MASATRMVLDPQQRGDQADALMRSLERQIVGQPVALEKIVDAYQMFLAGLSPQQRPVANFLFLGPTGTGKTRVVEALAEALFHNPNAVIKVDCGEFQHSHEIAKLIGSPPGYLGHRETHPVLTQDALDQYHQPDLQLSLVLFDEIEKASDALWQLLLGILDRATLTLGDNRRVNFCRTMIFMTSNLGAGEMQNLLQPRFGFAPASFATAAPAPLPPPASARGGGEARADADKGEAAMAAVSTPGGLTAGLDRKLCSLATEAARRKFSPEFFNRLDTVVVFNPLTETQLESILDLELENVRLRLSRAPSGGAPLLEARAGLAAGMARVSHNAVVSTTSGARAFCFECTAAARAFLLREGTDPKYGARHLKRAIERHLVHPIANLIATRQFTSQDQILVDWRCDAGLLFSRETRGEHTGEVAGERRVRTRSAA